MKQIVSMLAWPFVSVWMLVAGIVAFAARFTAMLLGLIFITVGVILTLTLIGAIVGVPLVRAGWELVRRGAS